MGFTPELLLFHTSSDDCLLAHEFVHLYNVKRLRPIELGPFDFEKPPVTGNLWIAEGVTSYYGVVVAIALLGPQEVRAQRLEPITYSIQIPAPETHLIEVMAVVPTSVRETIELMMPVWAR